ncbi:hypothetical protein A4X13_0g5769 [Tilletia indica]|uniref:Uncharacterized protein n=1 Tax=Tilletia indica TaxID=43049 RepID=A0A177TRH3_9BASI|nr:hypothetical protein A4X13_0g5769 [Tilletia indica]
MSHIQHVHNGSVTQLATALEWSPDVDVPQTLLLILRLAMRACQQDLTLRRVFLDAVKQGHRLCHGDAPKYLASFVSASVEGLAFISSQPGWDVATNSGPNQIIPFQTTSKPVPTPQSIESSIPQRIEQQIANHWFSDVFSNKPGPISNAGSEAFQHMVSSLPQHWTPGQNSTHSTPGQADSHSANVGAGRFGVKEHSSPLPVLNAFSVTTTNPDNTQDQLSTVLTQQPTAMSELDTFHNPALLPKQPNAPLGLGGFPFTATSSHNGATQTLLPLNNEQNSMPNTDGSNAPLELGGFPFTATNSHNGATQTPLPLNNGQNSMSNTDGSRFSIGDPYCSDDPNRNVVVHPSRPVAVDDPPAMQRVNVLTSSSAARSSDGAGPDTIEGYATPARTTQTELVPSFGAFPTTPINMNNPVSSHWSGSTDCSDWFDNLLANAASPSPFGPEPVRETDRRRPERLSKVAPPGAWAHSEAVAKILRTKDCSTGSRQLFRFLINYVGADEQLIACRDYLKGIQNTSTNAGRRLYQFVLEACSRDLALTFGPRRVVDRTNLEDEEPSNKRRKDYKADRGISLVNEEYPFCDVRREQKIWDDDEALLRTYRTGDVSKFVKFLNDGNCVDEDDQSE